MQSRMTLMNARGAVYWMATTLTALCILSGGAANLSHAEVPLRGLAELGYPAYFATILGAWKVLGGLVLLAPRLPRLKEWAYAGIAFALSGAAFSHAAVGDPAVKVIVPLVILGLAVTSWALRPASRVLGAVTGEPAAARIGAYALAKAGT
ncbi:DoxX family protein [Archangium lipolyticum]|uniref:DoxX family protein n=1 Tax=Archangium lipolyticum TaxID=2970465 RepID=UPI00214A1ACA|nr:DoxX family protein [Archangium lipolyticum]